jgi:hypothetical protein
MHKLFRGYLRKLLIRAKIRTFEHERALLPPKLQMRWEEAIRRKVQLLQRVALKFPKNTPFQIALTDTIYFSLYHIT